MISEYARHNSALDKCTHCRPIFFSSVYEWFLRLLLICVKIILSDENKISNTHNILAVVTLQTFTSRKLIYHEKIYLNLFMENSSWVSIFQDQKVTPTLVTHLWDRVNKLQNSKTFWHANQIIKWKLNEMSFFSHFILIFYLFFSTSTAIKSYVITLLFSQLFFLIIFLTTLLFSQWGPQAISLADSIVVSSLECKLFPKKKINILIVHRSQSDE